MRWLPEHGWTTPCGPPAGWPPGPGILDRAVNRTRDGLVSSVALNRPSQKALVPSLVVGDTPAVPEQIAADFKATSLTHLMAVTGDTDEYRGALLPS